MSTPNGSTTPTPGANPGATTLTWQDQVRIAQTLDTSGDGQGHCYAITQRREAARHQNGGPR